MGLLCCCCCLGLLSLSNNALQAFSKESRLNRICTIPIRNALLKIPNKIVIHCVWSAYVPAASHELAHTPPRSVNLIRKRSSRTQFVAQSATQIPHRASSRRTTHSIRSKRNAVLLGLRTATDGQTLLERNRRRIIGLVSFGASVVIGLFLVACLRPTKTSEVTFRNLF